MEKPQLPGTQGAWHPSLAVLLPPQKPDAVLLAWSRVNAPVNEALPRSGTGLVVLPLVPVTDATGIIGVLLV